MHEASLQFLKNLLHTPSPSGFERPIQNVVRDWAGPLADEMRTDRHGNVLAVLNPTGQPRIMLAGHCDQIGLMVQHIDDNGFLYVQPIGGWDMQILLGQNLTVWAKDGPIAGVLSRKAPHLLSSEDRKKVPEFNDVWIDIGAKDRKEAEALILPGDPVTLALGSRDLRNRLLASPALDDKVGVWTVMETLRLLSTSVRAGSVSDGPSVRAGSVSDRRTLQPAVFCVSTVQEEIGLRGAATSAYGIHPAIGIAVDVCHATDTPGNDKKKIGDIKLGKGPVLFRGPNINPHVFQRLNEAAGALQLGVQICGSPRATGTDANAIQLSRDGVATGLVGIPNRYMHSPVETASLDDLDRAAQLLAEFCTRLTPEMDWTP